MTTDAGWQKEDGLRDDMWLQMAWKQTPRDKPSDDCTCDFCIYGLKAGTYKEGREWNAQVITVYQCYLGRRTGLMGSSIGEMCEEGVMQLYFPESASARAARTGGLESAGT